MRSYWKSAVTRLRSSAFRCEEQEHQIHGLIVQGLEIDGLIETREDADDGMDACQLTVRNSDPVTDAGRAKACALQDNIENFPLRKPCDFRRLCSQFLEELFLGIYPKGGNDRILLQQICQSHFIFLLRQERRAAA